MRPRFAAMQQGLEFGIAVRDSSQEFQPAWGATVVTTYIVYCPDRLTPR